MAERKWSPFTMDIDNCQVKASLYCIRNNRALETSQKGPIGWLSTKQEGARSCEVI